MVIQDIETQLDNYTGVHKVIWPTLEDLGTAKMNNWSFHIRDSIDFIFSHIRPRICMVCRKSFGRFDLHHGIVSRRDVQGWPKLRRCLIDVEMNLIPLHHFPCHMNSPPSREAVWKYQVEFYGRELLERWYYFLPWKAGPPRLF